MSDTKEILLRLRRQYSQNEAVKLLNDERLRLQFEIGVLKSEKSELEDQNLSLKSQVKKLTYQLEKRKHPSDAETELRKGLETTRKKNTKLQQDLELWRNKYFNVINSKK